MNMRRLMRTAGRSTTSESIFSRGTPSCNMATIDLDGNEQDQAQNHAELADRYYVGKKKMNEVWQNERVTKEHAVAMVVKREQAIGGWICTPLSISLRTRSGRRRSDCTKYGLTSVAGPCTKSAMHTDLSTLWANISHFDTPTTSTCMIPQQLHCQIHPYPNPTLPDQPVPQPTICVYRFARTPSRHVRREPYPPRDLNDIITAHNPVHVRSSQ